MDSTARTKVELIEEAARLGYVVVECPKCKTLYAVPRYFPRKVLTPCCKKQAKRITSDEHVQTGALKASKSKIWLKEDVLKKIQDALRSEDFDIQVCENCVFANRNRDTELPLRLFISVQEKESAQVCRYADAKITTVFHVSKFRQRLSNLVRWWFHPEPKHIDELNQDVLTSFGWHAYLNEDTRQENLLVAENELGESHVANVLLWLKNSWRNNPQGRFEEYYPIASQDYNWFCSNVGKNAKYFRLKQELLTTLQAELRRLVREGKIKFFKDTESIERFYLITY